MRNGYFAEQFGGGESRNDGTPEGIAAQFQKFYVDELTHKGITKIDYLEHLTYLLYLKIDYERSQRASAAGRLAATARAAVPDGYSWRTLVGKSGEQLRRQFANILEQLGNREEGIDHPELSTTLAIFRDAHAWNEQRMADLAKLIEDEVEPYRWSDDLPALGAAYELLLAFCANEIDKKRETGQVITPRPLLRAIAAVLDITDTDVIFDPASGTGGTLLAAYQRAAASSVRLAPDSYVGADRDPQMVRLSTMNLLLNTGRPFHTLAPVQHCDSLEQSGAVIHRPTGSRPPSVAICNPPYRSNTPQPVKRQDLQPTSNFPANFLQHISEGLPISARAAVFVPDNVLFTSTAGSILRNLMVGSNVHTLLRLPAGIFRNGTQLSGVKANVLFFDKTGPHPSGIPATTELWVYDARSGGSQNMSDADLDAFIRAYGASTDLKSRVATAIFGRYPYSFLKQRGFQLADLYARPEAEAEPLRSPGEIAREIAENLAQAQRIFTDLADQLP